MAEKRPSCFSVEDYFALKHFLKEKKVEEAQALFAGYDPNAQRYGSNIFSSIFMPREFALWAREQGADVNFRGSDGRTPIFKVIQRSGNIPLLLELGADASAVDNNGCTPLHIAAAYGDKKIARALLKAGAQVDQRTADHGGFGAFTPLETALYSDISCTKKLEISRFLLDQGAELTERGRRLVSAFSEAFRRHNAKRKPTKTFPKQEEALMALCDRFDVEPLPAADFHDGVSPIVVTTVGGGYGDLFQELWSFLVPPGGRAQTAQGEVIRIAGRVQDELLRNGGMNWDDDYREMLDTFARYLHSGNPVTATEQPVEEITAALRDGDVNDKKIWDMCYLAKYWVMENPEAMPLLEAGYTR